MEEDSLKTVHSAVSAVVAACPHGCVATVRVGWLTDLTVIVPKIEGDWLTLSAELCHDIRKVSVLIEPVLMEQDESSPLYRDVMRTGVAV